MYRSARTRRQGSPMPYLECNPTCDECGRHRSHGKHTACSKKRQAKYQNKG